MSDTNRHSKRQFETLHSQIAACKEKLTKVQNSNTKEEILEMKQRIERLKNELPQVNKKSQPVERKVSTFMELAKGEQVTPPCQVIDASQELSFSQLQKIFQPIQNTEVTKIEEPIIRYEEDNVFGTKHFNEHYFQSIHEQSNTLHSGSYHKVHTNTYANMLLTEKTNTQLLIHPNMVNQKAPMYEEVRRNAPLPMPVSIEQQVRQKVEEQISSNEVFEQITQQSLNKEEPKPAEQQLLIEEEPKQIEQQPVIEEEPKQIEQQPSIEEEPKPMETQPLIEEEPEQIEQKSVIEEELKQIEQQPVIEEELKQIEQQPVIEEEPEQIEQQPVIEEEPKQAEQQPVIEEEPKQTEQQPTIEEELKQVEPHSSLQIEATAKEEPAFTPVQLESPLQQLEPSVIEQPEMNNIQEAQNDDEAPKQEKRTSFWNFFKRKR